MERREIIVAVQRHRLSPLDEFLSGLQLQATFPPLKRSYLELGQVSDCIFRLPVSRTTVEKKKVSVPARFLHVRHQRAADGAMASYIYTLH